MNKREFVRIITCLTEAEMMQLYADINNVEVIERLKDSAYKFCEEYVEPEEHNEWAEWRDNDNARRAREFKSDNERPY